MRRFVVVLLLLFAGGLTAAAIAGPESVREAVASAQALLGDEEAGGDDPGEPEGEPLDYVALGDSLAAGFAAPSGYPEHLAQRLEESTGRPVEVEVAAQIGWTTRRLRDAVDERAPLREALADADLVTVSVGSNDLFRAAFELGETCAEPACARPPIERFHERWEDLLAEIDAHTDARVVVTDFYDPFAGRRGEDELTSLGRELRAEANRGLRAAAEQRGFVIAPVEQAFHGADGTEDPRDRDLIAFDGIHPNRAGQERIADAVEAALQR
ncbi:SGNH/GDSL hydrolase family protein [Egibacter rhizosphaerae]|uniref:SGNH/GDSL hydrolase family protein n=1 Tax=Egibacter rhizosphaerae TaxID=1670831 RepID=UPI0013F144B1|nr:SGNH/GDSL hydrolase family protein [Egibacter rhizosphaerae]